MHLSSFLLLASISLTFALFAAEKQKTNSTLPQIQVCHGSFGCFSPRPGYQRLPQSPEDIGVQFFLYTRDNTSSPATISYTNLGAFDIEKATKFIIHGFTDSANASWVSDMARELLKFGDYNVVAVDWSKGNQFPYGQAVANTVTTAAVIVQLLGAMIEDGLRADQVHLIGHSLGAHVCSYVGQNVPGISRISGLDPAGPDFYNALAPDRLDPNDATFVDVIHTDGAPRVQSGFGHLEALGHVDFYPNGGSAQPTCARNTGSMIGSVLGTLLSSFNVDAAIGTLSCNHQAAILYYIDSINTPSPQNAYPCSDFRSFKQGECFTCDVAQGGCNRMGFHASPKRQLGSLYLYTLHGSKPPHFGFHYVVTLESDVSNEARTRGVFKVKLNGQDVEDPALEQDVHLRPNSTYSKTILAASNPGVLEKVSVQFTKQGGEAFGWGMANKWRFHEISVIDMQQDIKYKFCPSLDPTNNGTSAVIKSGSTGTFTLCL